MNEPLLNTKISIPEPNSSIIKRPDLLRRLDKAISDHRMTLVSAQAGHGKTTLLSQWASQTEIELAWLSLDEDDSEFDRFMRYVLAAWERVDPQIISSDFALLVGSQGATPKAINVQLLNALAAREEPITFVLDNYHLIHDEIIHQSIGYWVEHLPQTAKLVLSSRHQPPFALHRLRARNQLSEFGAADLRFSPEEAGIFLRRRLEFDLKEGVVDDLYQKLDGWAGGFQLAALGLMGADVSSNPLGSMEGTQQYLGDFLAKEVLERQPFEIQDFLLRTSHLQQLCTQLCDYVLQREDSSSLLSELHARNLPLQALDSDGIWFRYQHLFAEFLKKQSAARHESDFPELHRRAAQWYLEHKFEDRAFHHALASGDAEQVLQVCDRFIPLQLSRGEIRRAQEWLSEIPEAWFRDHPMLSLGRAAYNAMRGDFEAAMGDLKITEDRLAQVTGKEVGKAKARLNAFYCSTACMQNDLETARSYGQKAARELAPNDIFYHGMIHGSMGDTFRASGQWEKARHHYQQALRYSQGTDFQFMGIHAYGGLADMCLRQGNLSEAADFWRRALRTSQEPDSWGAIPLPVVGWAYIRLAEIKYEWNELQQAESDLRAGLKRAELGGDPRAMLAGEILRGYLNLANGAHNEVEAAIESAETRVEQSQFPDWTHRFKRLQIDYWLASGNIQTASSWLKSHQVDLEAEIQPGQEPYYLGIARLLLAKGAKSATDEALALLTGLEEKARSLGEAGIQLQSQALLALAHWQSRREAEAFHWLERALRLAQTEGYTRSLLDLGRPMAQLLQRAEKREIMPEYVSQMLEMFQEEMQLSDFEPALTEPLTEREVEVLQLMAAGLTNNEIAEKLVIAPGTVKKHAGNIYGKLNVNSRTAAAARARDLALLE